MTNLELFKDSAMELIFLDNGFWYRSDQYRRYSGVTVYFSKNHSYSFNICEAVAIPSRDWMYAHKDRLVQRIIKYFEENESDFREFIRYTYKIHPTKMKSMGFTLLEGK